MILTLMLLSALAQQTSAGSQLKVTSARVQVGCATVEQYEKYHTSTYEKDGAIPQTAGCVRLDPGTDLKDLGKSAQAKVYGGDKIPVQLYEVVVYKKTLQLWLSPSSVEKPKVK